MKTKKILALFLAVCLSLSTLVMYGCTGAKDVMGLEIDDNCYVNRKLTVGYTQSTYESTMENIEELIELVTLDEASELSCQILCLMVSTKLYKLIDAVNVANLYYYSNTENEANKQGYTDLYEKYSLAMNEFKKLYPLFAESKTYKTIFYGEDTTDEEIAELVSKAVSSDELVTLENKVVELKNEYETYTNEQIFGTDFNNLYSQFVTTNNAIAAEYDYSDYLEYSYENVYEREFTPSDTLTYCYNLSDNLVNAAESAYYNYTNASETIGETRVDELDDVLNSYFLTDSSLTILDGFYKSLGDEIYSIYKYAIQKGYYFIANSSTAYQGAYTNYFVTLGEPYMYFSSSYATLETFVHEFGHYLRFYLTGRDLEGSYELMETHSQGAEWLFMSYLSNLLDDDELNYVVCEKFVSDAYMVLLSANVGAAEVEIYRASNISEVDFDVAVQIWSDRIFGEEIPSMYSKYYQPTQYFRLVSVNSPGYYISYSVSMISSLELYVLSLNSYDEAVDAYSALLKSEAYVDALIENGLSSPFDKQSILDICKVFINDTEPNL